MSTRPMTLDVALDVARHPGSYGRPMTALALDVLADQVERLRGIEQRARKHLPECVPHRLDADFVRYVLTGES